MDEEKRGAPPPQGEGPSEVHEVHRPPFPAEDAPPAAYSELPPEPSTPEPSTAVAVQSGGAVTPPPPPSPPADPEDQEEEGMLRMSFMEHLEELRSRIIKALYGLGFAFVFSLVFAGKLWDIISDPAVEALKHLGVNPPRLAQLTPMESFSIIWVQLPLLCSVFLASPWMVYQLWAFISPGLYKRERRWALPFVLLTAGLFISGGLFAYFLAFRFGLEFLLGIGMSNNVQPVVSITEYFDLFVNVTLGVGLVFELPVLIFLLTLLRILSPRFLLRHSRYAILAIVIIAAIITPTPDVFNLMLFAIPMCALYFVGIFFAYLLVLKREGKKFPWKQFIGIIVAVLAVAAALYAAFHFLHLHLLRQWPFVTR
ncbi:MAG TPA: twin-arginine translocase subunit TatC [Bryobacteraceae bacterium]|nr:twin-arginine translocase subunit TatC [Bryobacteraceae bacterium]